MACVEVVERGEVEVLRGGGVEELADAVGRIEEPEVSAGREARGRNADEVGQFTVVAVRRVADGFVLGAHALADAEEGRVGDDEVCGWKLAAAEVVGDDLYGR
jgi:hypothetical protein